MRAIERARPAEAAPGKVRCRRALRAFEAVELAVVGAERGGAAYQRALGSQELGQPGGQAARQQRPGPRAGAVFEIRLMVGDVVDDIERRPEPFRIGVPEPEAALGEGVVVVVA